MYTDTQRSSESHTAGDGSALEVNDCNALPRVVLNWNVNWKHICFKWLKLFFFAFHYRRPGVVFVLHPFIQPARWIKIAEWDGNKMVLAAVAAVCPGHKAAGVAA